MIMAIAMLLAVALVGLVGFLLSRAPQEERVSDQWRHAHVRERRDDA